MAVVAREPAPMNQRVGILKEIFLARVSVCRGLCQSPSALPDEALGTGADVAHGPLFEVRAFGSAAPVSRGVESPSLLVSQVF